MFGFRVPTIRTPLGTFGEGTVAQLIDNISRGSLAAQQHVLLGEIAFDLITYLEGMDARIEADYAELAILGGKPRLQCVGDKLDEYTWQVVLHAGFCDPVAELEKLIDAVRAHEALPMVFANGDYRGWFVPVSVAPTWKATSADGTAIWVEATLQLKEHVLPPVLVEKKEPPKAAEKAGKDGKVKNPAQTKKRTAPERPKSANMCRAGS